MQGKPKPDDRQDFGQRGKPERRSVALSFACQWYGPQAVSYSLTIDERPFSILTVTPSYRWFEGVPEFAFGKDDIPVAVTQAAWADLGPLVVKLATDAALELLRVGDAEREKIHAMLSKAGELLSAKPVPYNPPAEGTPDGE